MNHPSLPARLSSCVLVVLGACSDDLTLFGPQDDLDGGMLDAGLPPIDTTPIDADVGPTRDARGTDGGAPPAVEFDGPEHGGPLPPDGSPSISDRRVLAAFGQTCVIYDSDLYCWGDNRFGQRGSSVDPAIPTRIEQGPFSEVCAAEEHSCALRTDGVALCWGRNDHGQLGVGDPSPRERPTPVVTEPSERFVSISCGGKSTCGIAADGELFCWGDNTDGQLGALEATSSALPVRIASELRVGQVSVGQGHACAVALGGALYCWGRNTERQVGVATSDGRVGEPFAVDPENRYLQVGAGQRHSCAIRRDGRLFCWGDQQYQLLGSEPNAGVAGGLRAVGDATEYEQVVVGWFHSCARRRDGSLRCWGRNVEGQLGIGSPDQGRSIPTPVSGRVAWIALTVGQFHTCALSAAGLGCWGRNSDGELGLGDRDARGVPALVPLPEVR